MHAFVSHIRQAAGWREPSDTIECLETRTKSDQFVARNETSYSEAQGMRPESLNAVADSFLKPNKRFKPPLFSRRPGTRSSNGCALTTAASRPPIRESSRTCQSRKPSGSSDIVERWVLRRDARQQLSGRPTLQPTSSSAIAVRRRQARAGKIQTKMEDAGHGAQGCQSANHGDRIEGDRETSVRGNVAVLPAPDTGVRVAHYLDSATLGLYKKGAATCRLFL